MYKVKVLDSKVKITQITWVGDVSVEEIDSCNLELREIFQNDTDWHLIADTSGLKTLKPK